MAPTQRWLTAVLAAAAAPLAHAKAQYVSMNPNGANVPDGAGGFVASIGHVRHSGGGSTNPYGNAFGRAVHVWTADLCTADSDGDGYTNGGELGDPCCEWTLESGLPPRYADHLSLPGDAASTPPPRPGCVAAVCANGIDPCTGRAAVPPAPSPQPDAPPSMPDSEVGMLVAGVAVVCLAVGMGTQWVRLRRRRRARGGPGGGGGGRASTAGDGVAPGDDYAPLDVELMGEGGAAY